MADRETIADVIPITRPVNRKDNRRADSETPIFDDIIDANRRKIDRLAEERLKKNEKTLEIFKIKRRTSK